MGVLNAEEIDEAIKSGAIELARQLQAKQLQPASLDLTIGRRGWRVRASFLPPPGKSVAARLADGLAMQEFDLSRGAVLERDCVYLVELAEKLRLPRDIAGAAASCSSTRSRASWSRWRWTRLESRMLRRLPGRGFRPSRSARRTE